jgi:hypothetical protein
MPRNCGYHVLQCLGGTTSSLLVEGKYAKEQAFLNVHHLLVVLCRYPDYVGSTTVICASHRALMAWLAALAVLRRPFRLISFKLKWLRSKRRRLRALDKSKQPLLASLLASLVKELSCQIRAPPHHRGSSAEGRMIYQLGLGLSRPLIARNRPMTDRG